MIVVGVVLADGARSRYQYIKTVVRSGQILKLLAVYEDIAEQSTRSKRLSWPLLGSKQQSTQYAQCMTIKKQVGGLRDYTRQSKFVRNTQSSKGRLFPRNIRVVTLYYRLHDTR